MKNIIRWTCGNVSDAGYEVLLRSIKTTQKVFNKFNFDYVVCCNNQKPEKLKLINQACSKNNVKVLIQNWSSIPIKHPSFINQDQACTNGLWKVCPARMRPDAYEIILDNDLILTRVIPEIEEFLQSNKILTLEDPLRWFGQYDHTLAKNLAINTGIIGLPPRYNFGQEINQHWIANGSKHHDCLGDEQGLLALTIMKSQYEKIVISKNTIIELHPNGIWHCWDDATKNLPYQFNGEEGGFHFVEINRKPDHKPWQQFKEIKAYG